MNNPNLPDGVTDEMIDDLCVDDEDSWRRLWTEKLLQDPDTVSDGIWYPRYPKSPLYESKAAQLEYDANQLVTLRNLFRKTYESNGQDTESCAMIGQIFSDNYANYVDKVAAKSAGVR